MKSNMKREVSWNLSELTGLLEDKDSCVHFERTKKHFALHPFHLTNLKTALNEILSFTLNCYDPELKGFLLAYKNLKSLRTLGETFYDNHFIHMDLEADFYVFRPRVGCSLKGIVSKKGLDYIVVLVNKTFTVSIPKPDDTETWPGDSIKIGKEVKCYVTHIDNNAKLPFICAALDLNDGKLSHNVNNIENTKMIIERNTLENVNSIVEATENDISHKEGKKSSKKKRSRDLKPICKMEPAIESVNDTLDNFNQIVDKLSVEATENDISNKEGKKSSKKKRSHDIKPICKMEPTIVLANDTLDNVKQIADRLKVEATESDTTPHKEKNKSSKRKRSHDLKPICKMESVIELDDDTIKHSHKKIKYDDEHEKTKNHISNNDDSLNDSGIDSVSTKQKKRKKIFKELSDSELKNHIVKVKVEKPEVIITDSSIEEKSANSVKSVEIILENCRNVERYIKREKSSEDDILETKHKKSSKKHRKKPNESDSEPVAKVEETRRSNNMNNSSGIIKNNNKEQYKHIKHEMTYTDTDSSNSNLNCISKKPKKRKTSFTMPNLKIEK